MIRVVTWTLGWAAWFAFGAWALLTFGCATSPSVIRETYPREAEAARLVWTHYERTDSVPRVEWIQPGGCVQRTGAEGFLSLGRCVGGETVSDGYVRSVPPNDGAYHLTALAHELLHAAWMREGTPVPHHIEVADPVALCGAAALAPAVVALCARHRTFYAVVEGANQRLEAGGL